jgi:hypothetical protein
MTTFIKRISPTFLSGLTVIGRAASNQDCGHQEEDDIPLRHPSPYSPAPDEEVLKINSQWQLKGMTLRCTCIIKSIHLHQKYTSFFNTSVGQMQQLHAQVA